MSSAAPHVLSSVRPVLRASPSARGLARRLREDTAGEHHRIEAALDLPGAIRDVRGLGSVLSRFRALYAPLGRELRAFPGWPALDLDPAARCPVPRLDRDLAGLGLPTPPDAPPSALPRLGTFPAALGALYVIEGSTLGGQVILRDLQGRLGPAMAGACAFFGGHGPATGALWQAMRHALDRFGEERPDAAEEVVMGAARSFRAIGDWMASAVPR